MRQNDRGSRENDLEVGRKEDRGKGTRGGGWEKRETFFLPLSSLFSHTPSPSSLRE